VEKGKAVSVFIANLFNKVYGYAIIVGLFISAFLFTYLKGRQDSSNATTRRTLEQDVATRRQADEVRSDVAAASDVDQRLRRWTRGGR
jgi:hypothetical protein